MGSSYNAAMRRTLIAIVALLAAACGGKDEPPPQPKAPEGRAETQAIRNTDAIGVKGSQIADKVDATLNANDQRVQQTDQAAQE